MFNVQSKLKLPCKSSNNKSNIARENLQRKKKDWNNSKSKSASTTETSCGSINDKTESENINLFALFWCVGDWRKKKSTKQGHCLWHRSRTINSALVFFEKNGEVEKRGRKWNNFSTHSPHNNVKSLFMLFLDCTAQLFRSIYAAASSTSLLSFFRSLPTFDRLHAIKIALKRLKMEEKNSNHMCSLNEAKAMKNQSEEEKGRCRGSEAKVHECVKGKITENNLEKKSLVASQHDSLGFSSIYTCLRSPSSRRLLWRVLSGRFVAGF